MEKKKITSFQVIVVIMLAVLILINGSIIGYLYNSRENHQLKSEMDYDIIEQGKYVLYIGTNDKDTYTQLISVEDAKKVVNEICSRYVNGYTVYEASGGWVDDNSTLTEENTLVYSFCGATEESIILIMDEVLEALNQSSIMVERSDQIYTYYQGK